MEIFYSILLIAIFEAHGQDSCEWGKYGENCRKDCPLNCFTNPDRNRRHCHKKTGECSEGCVPGWFDDLCDNACSKNCKGSSCIQQNGFCTDGCSENYHGKFCNITAVTSATPPPRGYSAYTSPTTSLTTPFVSRTGETTNLTAILVPILVVVLAVVVVVIIMRESRRIIGILPLLPCWRTTGTAGADSRNGKDISEPFIVHGSVEDLEPPKREADCWSGAVPLDAAIPQPAPKTDGDSSSVAVPLDAAIPQPAPKTDGDSSSVAVPLDAAIPQPAPKTDGDSSSVAVPLDAAIPQPAPKTDGDSSSVAVPLDAAIPQPAPKTDGDSSSVAVPLVAAVPQTAPKTDGDSSSVTVTLNAAIPQAACKREPDSSSGTVPLDAANLQPAPERDGDSLSVTVPSDAANQQPGPKLGDDAPCCFVDDVNLLSDTLEQKITDIQSVFLETESFKDVKVTLERHGHVTISGVPGEGKTSIALMLGAEYRKQGVELLVVEDVNKVQLSDYLEKGTDVCVIFDDIFKTIRSHFDLVKLEHFLYDLNVYLDRSAARYERRYQRLQQETREEQIMLNQPNIFLIFTADTNNLESSMSKLKDRHIFKSSSIVKLRCTNEEKKTMWLNYKRLYECSANVDVNKIIAYESTVVGFPLLCNLFSSCVGFQRNNESFFEKPVFYLKHQLQTNISSLDEKSAALILTLLCENQLNICQLETECASSDRQFLKEDSSPFSHLNSASDNPDLGDHLKAVATLVKTSTRQGVATAVRSFCGTLLTEGNTTTFSHSIIYDVCALVLFNIEPEFVLKHCSIKFLLEHVHDQQDDGISVNEHQLRIPISGAYIGTIADRIVNCFVSGALGQYIMHPIWKREEIADRLSKMVENPTTLSDDAKHNIFHYACITENKNILEQLLPHCDINRRGLNGWTSVMYAVVSEQMECFDILMRQKGAATLYDDSKHNLLHLTCQYSGVPTVKHVKKELKKRHPDLYHNRYLNGRAKNGLTPVMCAVLSGQKDVLDYLIKKRKKFDLTLRDCNNNTAFHLACWSGNKSIVESLLPHTDINIRGNKGQTPVMCAVLSESKETFDLLLSNKADITLTDDDINSLLHVASLVDDVKLPMLVSIVTRLGSDSQGKHGWTPVMVAAVNGNMNVFHLLLKMEADLELTDDNKNNILHLACHGGNVSIVKLLLPRIAINSLGNNRWTPVMFAAAHGEESVFHLLVSHGADVTLRDDYNNSVLHLACVGGNMSIVKYLLPMNEVNCRGHQGRTPILITALHAKPNLFKLLLSKGASITLIDDHKDTAFHLACQGGNQSIVTFLLPSTDINCRGNNGRTAIMITALHAKPNLFKLLVSKGADIALTDGHNDTAFHLACKGGNHFILDYLMPQFDINARGRQRRTPVMVAALAGRKDVFDLLVKHEADLTLTDDDKDSVLHFACQGGNTDIVEYILKTNLPGKKESSSLIHAERKALSGKKDASDISTPQEDIQSCTSFENENVKEVTDGFGINVIGGNYQTPLMRAVCGGHIAVVQFLMSSGADLTTVDKDGQTLLHLASQHGQLHMMKDIIDSVDINTRDKAGLTPIMTSVVHKQVAVFEYLTRKGADLSLADAKGNCALTLAQKAGCRQIIEQLEPAKKGKQLSGLKDTRVGKWFHSEKNRKSHK